MKNSMMRLFFLCLIVILVPQMAQAQEQASYDNVLHSYWKLAPPNSYDFFAEDYAKEFPDASQAIAENVEAFNYDKGLTVRTLVVIGPYVEKRGAFAFSPFSTTSRIDIGPKDNMRNLPLVHLLFSNAARIRSVELPVDEADAFAGGAKTLQIPADITFIPESASAISHDLKGRITAIRIDHSEYGILQIGFDDEGDIKEATYLKDGEDAADKDQSDEAEPSPSN